MTRHPAFVHRTTWILSVLILAIACMASAQAMASGPRMLTPGQWQWRMTESTPMGSKTFVISHCVKAGKNPSFGGDSQADACFHDEKLIDGPGNAVTYAFNCVSSNGPSTATSSGAYVVQVSRDGDHAVISGSILTDASFPGMSAIKIHSAVHGLGVRTGVCR